MILAKRKIQLFLVLGVVGIVSFFCGNLLPGSNFTWFNLAVFTSSFEPQEKNTLMEGKLKTNISIILDYVVDGTPDQIFNLWTEVSELKKFFCKDAVIGVKPGDLYEMYFLQRQVPRSDSNSTKGARLLEIKKDKIPKATVIKEK